MSRKLGIGIYAPYRFKQHGPNVASAFGSTHRSRDRLARFLLASGLFDSEQCFVGLKGILRGESARVSESAYRWYRQE